MMNFNQQAQAPVSSIVDAPRPAPVVEPKAKSGIGKTIAIIILSLTTAAFLGLFVWKFLDWLDASTNLEAQIIEATNAAVLENETEMEKEFAEREKNPFLTFAGPADYGSLTFSYPRTWSVYVAEDATQGGNFAAYMNPVEVPPVDSNDSIMSLRVEIMSQSFDNTVKTYDNYVRDGRMSLSVVNINNNKATANVYSGTLTAPSEAIGMVAVIKIRDKTAIIQTDSVLFEADFQKVLSSLTFSS